VCSSDLFGKSFSGLQGIKSIEDFDLKDQRVFIRLDLNVPMSGEPGGLKITDDTRIRAALPTVKYALDKGAKVVLASHLGRPETDADRPQYTLEPVAARLGELLSCEVILIEEPTSDAPKALLPGLKPTQLLLLENVRFEKGETKNAAELANVIAGYTDIYINDAFGASHRAHSTIDALPRLIAKRGCGFLIKKEVECLNALMAAPAKPFVAIMGGAKVSDKIGVIESMLESVDTFLIGGAMAYTFLSAKGLPVGKSRVEKERLAFARELLGRLDARGKKLLLPVDHIVANDFLAPSQIETVDGESIPEGMMGLDIGPKTKELYRKEISRAKTVFWNGPMGVFERPEFAKGSFGVAEALANLAENGGAAIVGGGDSAAAAEASGFAPKMTHISTGGGASLEYLEGAKLPGLEALRSVRESAKPTF
ncbi:MAG: phosphoglycerate kinase, partial [Bdellovibrionales bacterium]|jgi:phosphoglycerate kinase|nr:phosphoglycerate kinase [Bdellovibrionales bacterium]